MKKSKRKPDFVFRICEEREILHAHISFGCLEIPEIITNKFQALALLNDLADKISNFDEAQEIISQSDLPETEDEFEQILLEKIAEDLDFIEEDLMISNSFCLANQTLH